jgi:hypothetical protein
MSLGAQMSGNNQWGTQTRQVQPFLYPTEDNLVQTISQMMLGGNNPAIKGMQTSAVNNVNQSFAGMPRTIASRLSGLGFGKSGKLGTAMFNSDASRLNDISGLNSQFAQMGLNEQNTGSSLAEALLGLTMGTTNLGGGQSGGAGFSISPGGSGG